MTRGEVFALLAWGICLTLGLVAYVFCRKPGVEPSYDDYQPLKVVLEELTPTGKKLAAITLAILIPTALISIYFSLAD